LFNQPVDRGLNITGGISVADLVGISNFVMTKSATTVSQKCHKVNLSFFMRNGATGCLLR